MITIPQVATAMQITLTRHADRIGRQTRFVQRPSRAKLSGSSFAQTLVFGWLADPTASLDALTQTAAALGVTITPQALDQRFTPQAADCLKQVLAHSLTTVLRGEAVAIPVFERFTEVVILDCSTLVLPDGVAELWPGCGGVGPHTAAALKIGVQIDLRHGTLRGPFLERARTHDSASTVQKLAVAAGGLRLADAGFFNLDVFAALHEQGAFFLSRVRAGTLLFDEQGQQLHVLNWLATQGNVVDVGVRVGKRHQLRARLVAVRVPQEVADGRRRRLREEAKRKGQTVSAERLALVAWTLFITNVPVTMLSVAEILVVARSRWQIELLFKLWKSHGKLTQWQSSNPWRVLCEVYAKLLAMIIQHWLIVVGCWAYPDRSLPKAARTVRAYARQLASTLNTTSLLETTIETIHHCLNAGCRMNTRKTHPNTYQLLLDPSLSWIKTEHNVA